MSGPTDSLPLGGVLVGGQSRRFGSDKAAARVGDRSMAARAVDALQAVSDPVVLLGGDATLAERMALPWRADERPGHGPLSGLATGLRWSVELGRRGLLVLACDLPLVTTEVLEAIIAAAHPGLDAVVAEADVPSGVQPLCGWYAAEALSSIEDALAHGRLSVREILTRLRVERVLVADDADGVPLLNVNTPADLDEALRQTPASP
jgi:molybdopterin-guanine dinucleotide biosynthesis protein A